MCQGPIHDVLIALPKVEEHLHLEGTLEPELLYDLASRNNVQLPKDDEAYTNVETLRARYQRFTSLDDFLHYYFVGMSVLQTAEDFEALAYAYFTKAHSQNVQHAEVFFDPQAHTNRDVPYDTVVTGFTNAQARAKNDFNLSSELIVCMLRHFEPEICHQLYQTALPDLKLGKIRGLGLSGTEKNRPPHLFKKTFDAAKSQNINITSHAGEEADVDYMVSAIHDLGCRRIDHGVKLPQSPDLLAYVSQHKILITMCPISNVVLHVFSALSSLPIRTYLDAHVPFSINSDDPAYFGGNYIQENFCAVQEAFNLSVEDWARIVTDSITYSWASEQRKEELLQLLSDVLAKFT